MCAPLEKPESRISTIPHINNPQGLATDGNNVWIAEGDGRHAHKVKSDGSFLMQIGKAGVQLVDGETHSYLSDVAVDARKYLGGRWWRPSYREV